ncbi:hypothetical protein SLS63_011373 [Diaporthe eres]|uniref:Uncharacterized protein n=1 Tax=Diaporthe eres TaxID=83184 RepID=A0ABR1NU52_DIAER
MMAFCLLLGILLAFLGVASATPTGTPTTLEHATRASLGPRRNGYSDLPSLVASYNGAQPYNAIPEFVMASDPDTGNDAIVYTQEEIYTAMQRTRDPSPGEFVTYAKWNIASSQRQIWWNLNPGGMAPVGSIGMQVNSSNPPPVNMTPPGGPFDNDDPLQFPPWDNSTGVWQTYVPSNDTMNLTHEFEAADCAFARDHGAGGYLQSCQTDWGGGNTMKVRITVSGTGQNNKGWCQGIIDNMKRYCGGNFNLFNNVYTCNKNYPATATFSKATDPSDPGYGKYYYGIDLHFFLQWGWAERDADHTCMSKAVERGSCGSSNVKSLNGVWCRNVHWKPSPPPLEWSSDMGPA